uniref:UBA domain-containing protein n=1 Tax=Jaculus jaculus TaxID=51337 RepID=A0A8C5JYV5_JACJA
TSLPTSDGVNHPAHSLGQSPEIGSPTSLAHSVSASVCPIKPSDPDSIEHKAVKASTEFQIIPKKKDHLPLQDLSDVTPSAGQSPAMPLHSSFEEASAADQLEQSTARHTQGLNLYLHTRQEASLSVTTSRMCGPQVFVDENQNPSQVNGLEQHKLPGNELREVVQQNAPHARGHMCDMEDLELHEENSVSSLKAAVTGDELPKNAYLSSTEERVLPSGCFNFSHSETLMEVDRVEQSLVADSQNGKFGALDSPSMEVEMLKSNPLFESLNNSISTQDLQPSENNVEMSGTNREYESSSPSFSLCGSGQPSVESAEEPCSSVTAALKELHELLVISCKPAPENPPEEVMCHSETGAESQTGFKDLAERWTHSDQCLQTGSANTARCTSGEDVDCTSFGGPGDGLPSADEGVPELGESVSASCSVSTSSAESSRQLHCNIGVEISPKLVAGAEGAHDQTSEQVKSNSSILNPVSDNPETRENACPEAARPFLELEPPASQPSPSPSILPPLTFPATDIDRILRAGFTLQEAVGALHRVGGNADLALLVLLAKNIVVPT